MHDHTTRIIAILQRYASEPVSAKQPGTMLGALGIDRLDLPMIVLDIEDSLDVHVRHDDDIEEAETVGQLISRVMSRVAENAAELRRLAAVPRVKRTWLSTDAAHS